ncbi:LysR family transcriptional regulator [Serratia proteamaculans]|uniref:LysR family transcriptional regulator n=1 Tax=Serratia proteamaculans TaxID=28151 RepID=UPI00217AF657|nr:LysR family transcriptional regulator [Serratia proteamaculans]CAI1720106.1 D-malate degradation protein R [Serratia proteamaculans]
MRTELSGIPVFVAVAEAGSFANAAEKLHLTRSAISKIISRLEERLGVMLFLRTTRSQSLTDEGVLFYEHCRQALATIHSAETLLESGKVQASGRLRVSMPVLFGHLCIAPVLTELAQQHPQLTLELSFSDRRVDLIDEGFDLAIRIGTLPDSSSLVGRQLGQHGMTFCASPAYLQRYGEPQTLSELGQHQAVGYLHAGTLQQWQLKDANGGLQEIKPQARIVMDDMQAITDAAVSGAGVVWLPYWLAREHLYEGRLVAVMRDYGSVDFPVNAVWPHAAYQPLKVRLAVDQLLAQLPARLALIAP